MLDYLKSKTRITRVRHEIKELAPAKILSYAVEIRVPTYEFACLVGKRLREYCPEIHEHFPNDDYSILIKIPAAYYEETLANITLDCQEFSVKITHTPHAQRDPLVINRYILERGGYRWPFNYIFGEDS